MKCLIPQNWRVVKKLPTPRILAGLRQCSITGFGSTVRVASAIPNGPKLRSKPTNEPKLNGKQGRDRRNRAAANARPLPRRRLPLPIQAAPTHLRQKHLDSNLPLQERPVACSWLPSNQPRPPQHLLVRRRLHLLRLYLRLGRIRYMAMGQPTFRRSNQASRRLQMWHRTCCRRHHRPRPRKRLLIG